MKTFGNSHSTFFITNSEEQDCAAKLFNKLKHFLQPRMLRIFTDEKKFYQDEMVNLQNTLWLSLSPQDVPIVMKTKHPIHIMVFEVVTSDAFIHLPTSLQTQHRGLHQSTGVGKVALDQEGG